MKKRILVTGGAGFLGSHLCKRLLADNNEVLCLDNFYTGSKDNILDLMDNPYFEIIRHDITFPIYIEVDQIYNLACPASPVYYQKYPIQTTKTSVSGAINVLGLAKRLNIPVLQASTSEIYGDPNVHPQTEDYWGNVNTVGDRSCYDEGKRIAETLCREYARKGVKVHVARIFNTYGPNMLPTDGRVVSNFIMQCLTDGNITIYGNGSQTRSLCYVSDTIIGLIALMNSPEFGPINIGNPIEHSIKELAVIIKNLIEKKSYNENQIKFTYKGLPNDDPKRRQPNIFQAKTKLSWEPNVELVMGLDMTIEYFRQFVNK